MSKFSLAVSALSTEIEAQKGSLVAETNFNVDVLDNTSAKIANFKIIGFAESQSAVNYEEIELVTGTMFYTNVGVQFAKFGVDVAEQIRAFDDAAIVLMKSKFGDFAGMMSHLKNGPALVVSH